MPHQGFLSGSGLLKTKFKKKKQYASGYTCVSVSEKSVPVTCIISEVVVRTLKKGHQPVNSNPDISGPTWVL